MRRRVRLGTHSHHKVGHYEGDAVLLVGAEAVQFLLEISAPSALYGEPSGKTKEAVGLKALPKLLVLYQYFKKKAEARVNITLSSVFSKDCFPTGMIPGYFFYSFLLFLKFFKRCGCAGTHTFVP